MPALCSSVLSVRFAKTILRDAFLFLGSLVLGVVLSGCVTTRSELSDADQGMDQIREQMVKLRQDQQQAQSRRQVVLDEMRNMMQTKEPVIADSQEILRQKVAAPVQVVSGPAVGTPVEATNPVLIGVEAIFQNALAQYNTRNYSAAAQGFAQAYQQATQPGMKAACLYWMGESHYRNQEWLEAIQCFTRLVEVFPDQPQSPNGLLKKGYSFFFADDQLSGQQTLNILISMYPQTDEAALARLQLQRMKPVF